MTEQIPNDQFHASSFLQGHNAAYIEQLYARFANDPNAVDEAWASFFRELGDTEIDANARPPALPGRATTGLRLRPTS